MNRITVLGQPYCGTIMRLSDATWNVAPLNGTERVREEHTDLAQIGTTTRCDSA
jgi:hypothetical protein